MCAARPKFTTSVPYARRVPAFRRLVYFVVVRLAKQDYITVTRYRTKSFTDSVICYCSSHARISVIIDMNSFFGLSRGILIVRAVAVVTDILITFKRIFGFVPRNDFFYSGILYFL